MIAYLIWFFARNSSLDDLLIFLLFRPSIRRFLSYILLFSLSHQSKKALDFRDIWIVECGKSFARYAHHKHFIKTSTRFTRPSNSSCRRFYTSWNRKLHRSWWLSVWSTKQFFFHFSRILSRFFVIFFNKKIRFLKWQSKLAHSYSFLRFIQYFQPISSTFFFAISVTTKSKSAQKSTNCLWHIGPVH